MRTIIEIPDDLVQALDALGKQTQSSRAALIREAVKEYLTHHEPAPMEAAFGLWKGRNPEGVEYQRELRSEWEKGSGS